MASTSSVKGTGAIKATSSASSNRNRTNNTTKRQLFVRSDKQTGKYKCDECKYTSDTSYPLRSHKMTQHTVVSFMCNCPICGTSLRSKGSLTTHITVAHCTPVGAKMPDDDLLSKYRGKYGTFLMICTGLYSGNFSYTSNIQKFTITHQFQFSSTNRYHVWHFKLPLVVD